jgi:hypothetical protein
LRRSGAVAALVFVAALATSCWDSTLEAATNHVDVVQSQAPLSINKNPNLKVSVAALIEDANATVVVVSVDNRDTDRAAVWVPISVKLKDASGKVVASNTAGGNDESLTHFPSLPPGGTAYFVDDQFPPGLGATSATVALGGTLVSLDHPLPTITVTKVDTTDIGGGLIQFSGTVTNGSAVAQPILIVQGIATRGGTIVAAGTSVVRDLAPGAGSHFTGFFIGDPAGADTQVFAPPTAA